MHIVSLSLDSKNLQRGEGGRLSVLFPIERTGASARESLKHSNVLVREIGIHKPHMSAWVSAAGLLSEGRWLHGSHLR